MKVKFDQLMQPLLRDLPRMEMVKLTYTLFTDTQRLCDTANVCCIVDKFFSDSLVHAGKIEDDNYTIVLGSTYLHGGIDKGNARVEVTIEPIGSHSSEESNETMRITIIQSEIEEAIAEKVLSQMSINDDMELEIELSATRGPEGMTATIDVVPRVDTKTKVKKRKAVATTTAAKAEPAAAKADPEPAPKKEEEPVKEEKSVEEDTSSDATEAPRTGSIFGNLKKPVNEKTDG